MLRLFSTSPTATRFLIEEFTPTNLTQPKLGLVRVQRSDYIWPVYLLTNRGFELLTRRGKTRFSTHSQGVSVRLMRHEVATVGVGLVLTEMQGFAVSTARETWNWLGQKRRHKDARVNMPDFLLGEKDGNVEHVVEVELTPKSRKRYADIFTSHRRRLPDHRTSKILYIAGWPGGVDHITRLGYRFETSEVHAASLSDFRATLGRCAFAPSYRNNYGPFFLRAEPAQTSDAPRASEQAEVN